jgi:hypothetical protein
MELVWNEHRRLPLWGPGSYCDPGRNVTIQVTVA